MTGDSQRWAIEIALASSVCLGLLLLLFHRLNRSGNTLGLPLAFGGLLLLLHLPGGLAIIWSETGFSGAEFAVEYTAAGLKLTAFGFGFFVLGVLFVSTFGQRRAAGEATFWQAVQQRQLQRFAVFCMLAGWILQFFLTAFVSVVSIGATIRFGSALWMLGVAIGLSEGWLSGSLQKVLVWGGLLAVYPVYSLINNGFMCFGVEAMVFSLAPLIIRIGRLRWVVALALAAGFLGLNLFVNYFSLRDELRAVTWSDASLSERFYTATNLASRVGWVDLGEAKNLEGLVLRLNQNEFVGMAAHRIDAGMVQFSRGESFELAAASVVPRVLWPGKPITGGSGSMVADFTGLGLHDETSWGVGVILELYINFGLPSLALGMFALGALLRWLDARAFRRLVGAEPHRAITYFLAGVALCQPGGALSEITGACAAAVVGSYFWRFLYMQFFLADFRRKIAT